MSGNLIFIFSSWRIIRSKIILLFVIYCNVENEHKNGSVPIASMQMHQDGLMWGLVDYLHVYLWSGEIT